MEEKHITHLQPLETSGNLLHHPLDQIIEHRHETRCKILFRIACYSHGGLENRFHRLSGPSVLNKVCRTYFFLPNATRRFWIRRIEEIGTTPEISSTICRVNSEVFENGQSYPITPLMIFSDPALQIGHDICRLMWSENSLAIHPLKPNAVLPVGPGRRSGQS